MSHATVLHRWFDEVWNQGHEAAIDEMLAEDAIAHGIVGADGEEIRGIAAFKAYVRQLRTAFPDICITIEDAMVEGDKILARCLVTGCHTGPGLTGTPTGKTVTFTGMCLVHTKNDKIQEGWNNYDFLAMYQQLGFSLQ